MAKILMFGGSGLIGSHLYAALKSLGHKVFIQSRSDTFDIKLDPFDKNKILSTLFQLQPDLVINLINCWDNLDVKAQKDFNLKKIKLYSWNNIASEFVKDFDLLLNNNKC